MPMSALSATSVFGSRRYETSHAASPALLRSLLVIGCVAAALLAAASGEPGALVRADPQLAFLLRGMAAIKAALVLGAIAVTRWRFGWQVPPGLAAAYIAGTSALAGASVLIWQLSFIPLAAAVFHVAAFVVPVAAWRDRGRGHAH